MHGSFENVRGLVVSPSTWSETSVSGHFPAGQSQTSYISSTSNERNRFFVREDTGRETPVEVEGAFAVREGHEVTAIFFKKNQFSSRPVACFNHNTTQEYLNENILWQLYGGNKQGCISDILLIIFVIIAAGSVIAAFSAGAPQAFLVTFAALIGLRWTNRNMRQPNQRRVEGEAAVRAQLQRARSEK